MSALPATAEIMEPAIPRTGTATWIHRLFLIFIFSFAFDYRAAEGKGSGLDQFLFLAICLLSGTGIIALGWKQLAVRPGAHLIALWAVFLAFMLVNSAVQGVSPARAARVILPQMLFFLSLCCVHIAACSGIRPAEILKPIFTAACINIVWRIAQGFLFKDLTLENVRYEVQSPATGWLAAWIGCSLVLRRRLHPSLFLASFLLFAGIFITVTRSLIFPILASALASTLCFCLAAKWRAVPWAGGFKRLLPIAAVAGFLFTALGIAAVIQPAMIARWTDRLFHSADARNLTADISYLTRRAESDAIISLLNENPAHYVHGLGIGASYHWDASYLPEIWKVLPIAETPVDDIWFAGHSLWTYSLFSGGLIAIAAVTGMLGYTAIQSLLTARANASDPGRDYWIAFLPFVTTCCLLSETLTGNPFQDRLAGIFIGAMAGLPQAFLIRASWLHTTGGGHPA